MKTTVVILAVLALTLSGCGKKDEAPTPKASDSASTMPVAGVTVTAITLGSGIGPSKQIVQATDTFVRNDTIYASVDTTGAGHTTLRAKWTYHANGQDVPVREDAQAINPAGPATSEFHVSKPDGWPSGAYKVEISSSGNSSGTRTFTVK